MTHRPASTTVFEEPTMEDSPLVFQARFHRKRKGCRTALALGEATPLPIPRPCRVAIALALAHKIEQAINEGTLSDRAHAARLLGVTRARMTQNLDLLLLAPDIQEEIFRMTTSEGSDPLSQSSLRSVTVEKEWGEQRWKWGKMTKVT